MSCPSPDLKKQHSDMGSLQIQSSLFSRIKRLTRLQQLSGQTKFSYKLYCSETSTLCWTKGIRSNQTGTNRNAFYIPNQCQHISSILCDRGMSSDLHDGSLARVLHFSLLSHSPHRPPWRYMISNTMWCNWHQTLQKQNIMTISQQNMNKCDLQDTQNIIQTPNVHIM